MKLRHLLPLLLCLAASTVLLLLLLNCFNPLPKASFYETAHKRNHSSSSVSEKVRNKGLESARGLKSMKHSRIVQGMAAGRGIPGRVQCEGWEAVSRAPVRSPSCSRSDTKNKVSFASMLIPRNQVGTDGKSEFSSEDVSRQDKLLSVFRIFTESVDASMPSSDIVILSNSDLSKLNLTSSGKVRFEIIPGNYSRSYLMLQRLESYVTYLDHVIAKRKLNPHDKLNHVIFTDSDMIIVGDLGCVFEEHSDFDIALTFRNNRRQPVNSGVIYVRGSEKSLTKGKRFLQQVVKSYKQNFMNSAGMLGDQLAFAFILTHSPLIKDQLFQKHETFEAQILGVQVLFLPGAIYNWTPSEGAGQFHGMPVDVKVVHFKGSRKMLMLAAWKFHKEKSLSRLDFSDMKCLVLGSGRAKYDF